MKLKVLIKPDLEDGGYNVSCPALPGCHSQGETIEEAVANIQEAIEGCLEVLNSAGS
jgi:antitoxin HicB